MNTKNSYQVYQRKTLRWPAITFSRFSLYTVVACSPITGSAVALYCCKAHERISTNRKTGNSTPCKIVTPDTFSSKVCTRNYVGDGNYCANFCDNRFSGGFSPKRWNITPLWLFWLPCSVLSFPFFSMLRPGRTVGPIFALYGSNDVFPRKEVPLGLQR